MIENSCFFIWLQLAFIRELNLLWCVILKRSYGNIKIINSTTLLMYFKQNIPSDREASLLLLLWGIDHTESQNTVDKCFQFTLHCHMIPFAMDSVAVSNQQIIINSQFRYWTKSMARGDIGLLITLTPKVLK